MAEKPSLDELKLAVKEYLTALDGNGRTQAFSQALDAFNSAITAAYGKDWNHADNGITVPQAHYIAKLIYNEHKEVNADDGFTIPKLPGEIPVSSRHGSSETMTPDAYIRQLMQDNIQSNFDAITNIRAEQENKLGGDGQAYRQNVKNVMEELTALQEHEAREAIIRRMVKATRGMEEQQKKVARLINAVSPERLNEMKNQVSNDLMPLMNKCIAKRIGHAEGERQLEYYLEYYKNNRPSGEEAKDYKKEVKEFQANLAEQNEAVGKLEKELRAKFNELHQKFGGSGSDKSADESALFDRVIQAAIDKERARKSDTYVQWKANSSGHKMGSELQNLLSSSGLSKHEKIETEADKKMGAVKPADDSKKAMGDWGRMALGAAGAAATGAALHTLFSGRKTTTIDEQGNEAEEPKKLGFVKATVSLGVAAVGILATIAGIRKGNLKGMSEAKGLDKLAATLQSITQTGRYGAATR